MATFKENFSTDPGRSSFTVSGETAAVLLDDVRVQLDQSDETPYRMRTYGVSIEVESETEFQALKLDLRWFCEQTDEAQAILLVSFVGEVDTLTLEGDFSEEGPQMETYEVAFEEPTKYADFSILLTLIAERYDAGASSLFGVDSLDLSLLAEPTETDEE